MQRLECLEAIAQEVGDALCVSTAGGTSGEWGTIRPHPANLRARTLGLTSSIALGLALGLPHRKVLALDGDGSCLMNMCGLPTIAAMRPRNLIHIVFDNGSYESSGDIKTHARTTDLAKVAEASGYPYAVWTHTLADFRKEVLDALKREDLSFIGAKVELGGGREAALTEDEYEMKYRFIRYIEQTEGRFILPLSFPPL